VTSGATLQRRAAIDAARSKWIQELTDLSRRNNLLYIRELKIGTLALDVRDRDPEKWESFLAGESVLLFAMLPAADAKFVSAKAREIDRRSLSNLDERGLDTLFIAVGLPLGLRTMEALQPRPLSFSFRRFLSDRGARVAK
jgi:hypothetical protein